jgi:hypothetical protein
LLALHHVSQLWERWALTKPAERAVGDGEFSWDLQAVAAVAAAAAAAAAVAVAAAAVVAAVVTAQHACSQIFVDGR